MTTRRQRRAERTHRYNNEVAALVPDVRSAPDLEPGEKTTYKTPIRAQNVESDVLVPVLQALVYGGGAAVLSVWPTIWQQWPWYTPLLVWPTVTGASVFLTSAAAHRLLMVVEKWTGTDLDRDGQVGDRPREEIDVNVHDHTHTERPKPQVVRPRLFSPSGHDGALARYAAALIREDKTRAAFSYAGGKHINGAQFYGYTPTEFDELEQEALKAKLIDRERKNQPYKLTDRGRATFTRVAQRNQAHATLPPTP